ncbi:MAG TPA: hypothetical protein VNO54_14995, partial [Streptosporangiaceae bacterium]|nr:hypothetical protein [Streptosporangiaceae bacterium]
PAGGGTVNGVTSLPGPLPPRTAYEGHVVDIGPTRVRQGHHVIGVGFAYEVFVTPYPPVGIVAGYAPSVLDLHHVVVSRPQAVTVAVFKLVTFIRAAAYFLTRLREVRIAELAAGDRHLLASPVGLQTIC